MRLCRENAATARLSAHADRSSGELISDIPQGAGVDGLAGLVSRAQACVTSRVREEVRAGLVTFKVIGAGETKARISGVAHRLHTGCYWPVLVPSPLPT